MKCDELKCFYATDGEVSEIPFKPGFAYPKEKVDEAIAELRASAGWHTCSEGLPEVGVRVQCYMPKAEHQIRIMRLGPYDPEDGGSQWLDDDDEDDVVGYVLGAVTHWMPLPEAPEAKKQQRELADKFREGK